MAQVLSFLLAFSLVLNAVLGQETKGGPPDAKSRQLADANNDFALRILKQLPNSENVFFSPYSISAALGMVYLGARHSTAQEMEEALGYKQVGLRNVDVPPAYKNVQELLGTSSNNDYILEVANKVLKQRGSSVLDSYKSGLSQYFNTSLDEVDFATEGETIKNNVNTWVNNKTRGKITSVLDGPLDPNTVMLLLNAIYFKGEWKAKFNKKSTKPSEFYNSGEHAKKVPMMHLTARTNYASSGELKSDILELNYKGEDLSMIIILPHERKGLTDVETRLTAEKLQDALKTLQTPPSVMISLPRFKLETNYNLNGVLQEVGMRKIFGNADLSGISGNGGIYVSKIIHKAVVEVNEEGSEAAAVTAVIIHYLSLNSRPWTLTFNVDHPFIFAIREKSTGLILFLGRVNEL